VDPAMFHDDPPSIGEVRAGSRIRVIPGHVPRRPGEGRTAAGQRQQSGRFLGVEPEPRCGSISTHGFDLLRLEADYGNDRARIDVLFSCPGFAGPRISTHLSEKSGVRQTDFEDETSRTDLWFVLVWVSETLTVFASAAQELNFSLCAALRQETSGDRATRSSLPECARAGAGKNQTGRLRSPQASRVLSRTSIALARARRAPCFRISSTSSGEASRRLRRSKDSPKCCMAD